MIGELNNLGWILSNNEQHDIVIQKDDEMAVFRSDDEATKFVVESYNQLLEQLKTAKVLLDDCMLVLDIDRENCVKDHLPYINKAIKFAEQ